MPVDRPAQGLSRRSFLQAGVAAGGGLVLGFALPVPARRARAADPAPDPFAPNAFVRIGADDRVTHTWPDALACAVIREAMLAATVLTISVFITASAAVAQSPRTLCEAGERVYFSCVTESRGRVVSLCGSKTLTEAASYLQYRFGKPGAIELEFPSTREGSVARFRYSHYVRPLVDRQGISFDTGGYQYSVLHHYEAETPPEEVYAGVEVSKQAGGATSRELACKAFVTSELIALEDVVPCDPANALGSCAE